MNTEAVKSTADQAKEMALLYLSKVLEAAERGAQWTAGQVPEIIKEKLTYDFIEAGVWVVTGVLLFVSILAVGWHIRKIFLKGDLEDPAADEGFSFSMFIFITTLINSLISGPMVFMNLKTMIKIYFAPRLYIIEWLRDVVK